MSAIEGGTYMNGNSAAVEPVKNLYQITGNIGDINTCLVNRNELIRLTNAVFQLELLGCYKWSDKHQCWKLSNHG